MKMYEGNDYKLKKDSIIKVRNKYTTTYHYVLSTSLRYKKYISDFEKIINTEDDTKFNNLLLNAMESTAKDFNINSKKVYSSKKLNKKIVKSFHKTIKLEKKKHEEIHLRVIEVYKMIESKNYKELRLLSLKEPNDFFKALYLYTICED